MEHLNIFKVSNINSTLKNLREKNFWVYGFDARGEKDFTDIKWEGNNILLFGSEGFGMRQHTGKYADFYVKINMNDDIESLVQQSLNKDPANVRALILKGLKQTLDKNYDDALKSWSIAFEYSEDADQKRVIMAGMSSALKQLKSLED